MIRKMQVAQDVLDRLDRPEALRLDTFERDLVEELLERFIREEKAKEAVAAAKAAGEQEAGA